MCAMHPRILPRSTSYKKDVCIVSESGGGRGGLDWEKYLPTSDTAQYSLPLWTSSVMFGILDLSHSCSSSSYVFPMVAMCFVGTENEG